MNKKKKKITLVNEDLGEREFEFNHAERVLKLEAKSKLNNWAVHPNSIYTFTDGALTRKSNSGNTQQTEE